MKKTIDMSSRHSLPLDGFVKPMNPVRKPCEHRIIAKGHANDDEVSLSHLSNLHTLVTTTNHSRHPLARYQYAGF